MVFINNKISILLIAFVFSNLGIAQNNSLKEIIEKGSTNYGKIKALNSYAKAADENIKLAKRDYLPNLIFSAQQDYGSINGQNGPLYGFGGLGVASSGLPLPQQNWNAAFGGLYLANVNWEFFNFGKTNQKINVAKTDANIFQKEANQELFQHKIKISAAYLNLLASHRLLKSQEKNLQRSISIHANVSTRVKNGLLPGVDSTMTFAEVSKAKILLNQIKEQVKIQNNEVTQLIGEEPFDISVDTTLINKIPKILESQININNHPTLEFLQSKIEKSKAQEKLFRKEYLPTFSFFGVYQTRASGFGSDYATNQNSFSHNYIDGISPTRQNYLLGIGMSWNFTTIIRNNAKINVQKFTSQGLEEEYNTIDNELKSRDNVANERIKYATLNFYETPIQVNAAQKAYTQRTTLYVNGLTTLTDVTNALYLLNRAETDRDIAYTNVWQALLMKAAATGDFNLFLNEL